jgi:hypothetical protein
MGELSPFRDMQIYYSFVLSEKSIDSRIKWTSRKKLLPPGNSGIVTVSGRNQLGDSKGRA